MLLLFRALLSFWFYLQTLLQSITMNKLPMNASDLISRLVKQQLILRVGICEPRYIHKFHASPWLVQTTKVLRLDREKMFNAKDILHSSSGKRKRNIRY